MENINEQVKLPSLKGVTPLELARAIGEILDDKKGNHVKVIHVEDKTSIADYFVLCTGNSGTHVKALAGGLFGIKNIKCICAEGMDISDDLARESFEKAEREIAEEMN